MCYIKISFWNKKVVKRLFQGFLVYEFLIEKAHIKYVENIDLLDELPFYDELPPKQFFPCNFCKRRS